MQNSLETTIWTTNTPYSPNENFDALLKPQEPQCTQNLFFPILSERSHHTHHCNSSSTSTAMSTTKTRQYKWRSLMEKHHVTHYNVEQWTTLSDLFHTRPEGNWWIVNYTNTTYSPWITTRRGCIYSYHTRHAYTICYMWTVCN